MQDLEQSINNKKDRNVTQPEITQQFSEGELRVVDWGVVLLFLFWGVILNYFPDYANIHSGWIWLFRVPSILCYGIGIVGALIEFGKRFKKAFFNSFIASIMIATMFVVGAIAFHFAANGVQTNSTLALILRIGVLGCTMVGILGILMSLQYLNTSKERMKVLTETFTVKNIITLILSILGFLTVLMPFLQMVLPWIFKR